MERNDMFLVINDAFLNLETPIIVVVFVNRASLPSIVKRQSVFQTCLYPSNNK